MTAVEMFQTLEQHFKVTALYKVSFNKNLSQDALDIIQHLKGDLYAEDLAPNYPTSLNLIVKFPAANEQGFSMENFFQDSISYMSAFDEDAFRKFFTKCMSTIPSVTN